MKFKPRNDMVIVKLDEPHSQSRGGILLPENSKEDRLEGSVIAVGPGKIRDDGKRYPIDLKEGQRVFVSRFAGSVLGPEKDRLFLINEDCILLVIES